jgi:hypothetical protein
MVTAGWDFTRKIMRTLWWTEDVQPGYTLSAIKSKLKLIIIPILKERKNIL